MGLNRKKLFQGSFIIKPRNINRRNKSGLKRYETLKINPLIWEIHKCSKVVVSP
jgi:hypothetical protein